MSQHKDNLDQLRQVRDEFAKALEHFPDMRVGKRLAALDDVVKFTHHAQRGERGVHDQAQEFPGEVVDHGEYAEARDPIFISRI
jgi:hypothetical protein